MDKARHLKLSLILIIFSVQEIHSIKICATSSQTVWHKPTKNFSLLCESKIWRENERKALKTSKNFFFFFFSYLSATLSTQGK